MTTLSDAALILAPQGRDAELAAGLLAERRIDSRVCKTVEALVAELEAGAGFGIVTEEAVATANLSGLSKWIEGQDEWSDFPFILLTRRGGGLERNPSAARYLEALGNVTFLERPFHPTSLISLARSALRARRRQYEARSRLQAIRFAEERLTVALAAGGLGNWTLDATNFTLDASLDCKAHYGRAPGDSFTYEELQAAVHPDDAARMQAAVRRSYDTGEDYEIEYRCVWPDESVHWVQVSGRVEWSANGQMARMVGVSQDITERRAGEETLRALAVELEERVAERTREHERVTAQLHEAQKLETIGQLTGGVAHDFNNLLTPIMGVLDLIHRKIDGTDPQMARLVSNGLQSAERARTLVQRLLGFARRTALETVPVDLGALIESMRDLIRSSVGSTIDLTIEIEPGLPPALADPNQLELALLNLCVNARDAMPVGGSLTVSAKYARPGSPLPGGLCDGDYVIVAVTDTGDGMSEETIRRAIEPFFSTKETGRGTGLGLSMVHGLAAQLGGQFELESTLGKGTTARLWLCATEQRVEAAAPVDEAEADNVTRRFSILLVDDEPLVRMGTAEMIRDLGHDVVEASGGNEALSKLSNGFRPDLLVTDYKMPGMDGPELIRQAKSLRPALPVLLVTGYSGDTLSEDGIKRLTKPFGQSEIARALDAVMSGI